MSNHKLNCTNNLSEIKIKSETNEWAGHFSIAYINYKNKNKSD